MENLNDKVIFTWGEIHVEKLDEDASIAYDIGQSEEVFLSKTIMEAK